MATISGISAGERKQVPTTAEMPFPEGQCVHHLFEAQAERSPAATAVQYRDARLTYAGLNERANQLAHYLQRQGAGPGTLVGIALERGLELPVALLAVLKAGAAFLPLDPTYPRPRLRYMIVEAQLPLLITKAPILEGWEMVGSGQDLAVVYLDREAQTIAGESTQNPASAVTPDDLAYVIYTSGSTGQPKGVMVPHSALANHNLAAIDLFALQPGDRVWQFATINFDAALEEIFPTLLSGAALVLRDPEIPFVADLNNLVERQQLTVLDLPTAYWHQWTLHLAATAGALPAPLRLVIVGGEKAGTEQLALWRTLPGHERVQWLNTYGPTETTIISTAFRLDPEFNLNHHVPIGRPIANTQVYVLDEDRAPVPAGTPGELYIGGAGVARGYMNQPDLTAERFIPNPFLPDQGPSAGVAHHRLYRTGDLVQYLPDGNLVFLGRTDDQVKVRGFRVEPGEIDAVVSRHTAIASNVTIAREDTPGNLQLVTYFIPQPGQAAPSARELRAFLRQSLPEYMLPARFVVLDHFPLTPSNKIDRRALPAPDRAGDEPGHVLVPPRTRLETELAALCAQILNLDRVSVEDSFFDIGGNSLLAMQFIFQVRERYGAQIPLPAFFRRPTVAELGQAIAAARANEETSGAGKRAAKPALGPQQAGQDKDEEAALLAQSNLTRNQFLMWLGQRVNPGVPLYNVIQAFTIHGAVDVQAFGHAFQMCVNHSDALRTVIVEVSGVPQQRIRESVAAPVQLLDFSAAGDPEGACQAWIDERKMRPLPLDQQVFDTALIKLAAERFVWYLGQHHIITDALSEDLLFRRVAAYYELALAGRLQESAAPPQYARFAAGERARRQTEAFQQAVAYWREKARKPLPPTEFYDQSADDGSYRTERKTLDLGLERSTRLRQIARQAGFASGSEDLSLFTIFATLLLTTLHRINGQQVLRLGTPFHGRPTAESLQIMGLFIEMGFLEVDVSSDDTFASLGEKVMVETLETLAHIQPGVSSAATNRAYDVILNFVQPSYTAFAGHPVTSEWIDTGHIDKEHALRLQVTDFDQTGNFLLAFDMKKTVFGEVERTWLVDHFLRVVDAFVDNYTQPLGAFSLISEEERRRLLSAFNDTAAPYPADQTVVQLFEAQVARTPQAVAAQHREMAITYAELNERANCLAAYLREEGVGPESIVALFMDRSLEVLVAIWGVLKAGGAYLPIDRAYPDRRVASMIADAGPQMVLVTDGATVPLDPGQEPPPIVDLKTLELGRYNGQNAVAAAGPDHLVYLIYTSGSTGTPKGAMITHRGLLNYAYWARQVYQGQEVLDFPLYSSLSFDLTVTSLFVPLLSGGRVVIYGESDQAPGMEILTVFREDTVDIVKLTPAHLSMVHEMGLSARRIRKLIVGGEDFKTDLARTIHEAFGGRVEIYNEYGPTEAVVGCMIHRYDPLQDTALSVPIGKPAANARIYLLDGYDQPVPPGVIGEMVISSDGVARGYYRRPELTAQRFGADPFRRGARIYRTGDLARWDQNGQMVFLGRRDHQVKVRGARVELGEIEASLLDHPAIRDAVVTVVQYERRPEEHDLLFCVQCGMPSNYPDVAFDEDGVCSLCKDYDTFRADVLQYFRTMDDLRALVAQAKAERKGEYDCLMLYSGGKDSTYVLTQLVEMGLKILAFSLDNGYISEEAKENIRQVTDHLGVDLVMATTPHMDAIFVDSLQRFSNVCQGCYKAIYTLSMNLARQKGIKYIFTGLSRGQLFETRLDILFRNRIFDVDRMDEAILAARKVYHRMDDAVSRLLDVSMFRDDRVFQDIEFVDFFRYTDVELDELFDYLATRVPWIRPQDTGRSTNCLINEAGIFVHKTERGYHNYALPYSWDVRLGHKTREQALEELDDDIRLPMVQEMLDRVGYEVKHRHAERTEKRLAAYYVADEDLAVSELRAFLGSTLPDYMVPAYFVRLPALPLTTNGKVNRHLLPSPAEQRPELDAPFVSPETLVQSKLAGIWAQALNVKRVGIHDDFSELGGTSLPAVQVVARVSDLFGVNIPLHSFFERPTVAQQSAIVEDLLLAQLEALSDEEAEALLAGLGG